MKVLTFSRQFPKGHPKAGEQTLFIEKTLLGLLVAEEITIGRCIELARTVFDKDHPMCCYNAIRSYECKLPKHHTIRAGSRFKPGDMASLRVWSGKPYNSKQVEFAQVEVKKVWDIEIYQNEEYWIFTLNGKKLTWDDLDVDQFVDDLAKNDGLTTADFVNWFNIHPKKKEQVFTGQIICWDSKINYQYNREN